MEIASFLDTVTQELSKMQSFDVGDFTVTSVAEGEYTILYRPTAEVVSEGLCLFSAAIAIAKALHIRDIELAKRLLFLENVYAKHTTKMLFFENTKKWDLYENERIEAKAILNVFHGYASNQ